MPGSLKWSVGNQRPCVWGLTVLGNFYQADAGTSQLLEASGITSSFHFWPQLMGGGFVPTSTTGSVENFDIPTETQYWGAFSGFDRRPRDPTASKYICWEDSSHLGCIKPSCSHAHADIGKPSTLDYTIMMQQKLAAWPPGRGQGRHRRAMRPP